MNLKQLSKDLVSARFIQSWPEVQKVADKLFEEGSNTSTIQTPLLSQTTAPQSKQLSNCDNKNGRKKTSLQQVLGKISDLQYDEYKIPTSLIEDLIGTARKEIHNRHRDERTKPNEDLVCSSCGRGLARNTYCTRCVEMDDYS